MSYDPRDNAALDTDYIAKRKVFFVDLTGLPLDECTCTGCRVVAENNCAYQFDAYNTNGDCLWSK